MKAYFLAIDYKTLLMDRSPQLCLSKFPSQTLVTQAQWAAAPIPASPPSFPQLPLLASAHGPLLE